MNRPTPGRDKRMNIPWPLTTTAATALSNRHPTTGISHRINAVAAIPQCSTPLDEELAKHPSVSQPTRLITHDLRYIWTSRRTSHEITVPTGPQAHRCYAFSQSPKTFFAPLLDIATASEPEVFVEPWRKTAGELNE